MTKEIQKIEQTESTEILVNDNLVNDNLLDSYFKTLTSTLDDKERLQFIQIAKAYNLNPFKREIYCLKFGSTIQIITGYEVYLKRAEKTGKLDGWKAEIVNEKDQNNTKAIVTIFRKDWSKAFVHEVYFKEYNSTNPVWKSKPLTMLKKVAIGQDFRLAFPDECGGMPYEESELDTINDKKEYIDIKKTEEKIDTKIQYATKEQVEQLEKLIKELDITTETIQKWLDKEKVSSIEKMTKERMQMYIDFYEKKLEEKKIKEQQKEVV
jgi:phage recombination protein Bet